MQKLWRLLTEQADELFIGEVFSIEALLWSRQARDKLDVTQPAFVYLGLTDGSDRRCLIHSAR